MRSESLNIIELFASVQGETSFTGLPTTFIRLASCNLRCSWCDTSYSFGRGTPQTLDHILAKANQFGCKNVCITGGEPLLQKNVHLLMSELCNQNYQVSLETGGSLCVKSIDPRVHVILDIKCPGSKMDHKNLWDNLNVMTFKDEIKFVLLDRKDYEFAKEVCSRYNLLEKNLNILFSPVHGQLDPKLLVEWILEDKLPIRLNLQIHKFIWSPETKGV